MGARRLGVGHAVLALALVLAVVLIVRPRPAATPALPNVAVSVLLASRPTNLYAVLRGHLHPGEGVTVQQGRTSAALGTVVSVAVRPVVRTEVVGGRITTVTDPLRRRLLVAVRGTAGETPDGSYRFGRLTLYIGRRAVLRAGFVRMSVDVVDIRRLSARAPR